MKTFNILEVAGIVSATLLLTIGACGSWFIVEYNKLSDKLNAAEAVIEMVEEDWQSFDDVVGETDTYQNYLDALADIE